MDPTAHTASGSAGETQAHVQALRQKYYQERHKRLHRDGKNQYVELNEAHIKTASDGPSIPSTQRHDVRGPGQPIHQAPEHPRCFQPKTYRVLIIGAGFGGLLFAVRLLQAWFCIPTEIIFVDNAGGFGGVWYSNQYPGLMCDTESYIYLPLLEETGYRPTHKYVSGGELKDYARHIAKMFHLESSARFRTFVTALRWDEEKVVWKASLYSKLGFQTSLDASYVYMATGMLNIPKVPRAIAGASFNGHLFHSSRWDYEYTGGSPNNPVMNKLKDKIVGVVGTGPTAVQIIPQLAKYAKKLYVFQRTPSAVAPRNNSLTSVRLWEETIQLQGPGWQRVRMENFNAFLSSEVPVPCVDFVYDGWTSIPSYSCLVGGPYNLAPGYVGRMQELDAVHMDQIRHRVNVVSNGQTRNALKPWYYGWCKPPCFSDEYPAVFNRPNVTLVGTRGKGIDGITKKGVSTGNREYELDTIILCTGYQTGSSFDNGKLVIIGRDGVTLQQKWRNGISTLHGVMTNGFPNLFFPGPYQAGATGNQTYVLDQLARHVAFIIAHVDRRRYAIPDEPAFRKVFVEPTFNAEAAWTTQVAMRSGAFQALNYCTPGYFNQEGAIPTTSEAQQMAAQAGSWGGGVNEFVRVIEAWRESIHAIVEDLSINCRN
ncbi:hypothetical protein N7492_003341 [Penicillium capsulatum]|uniref:L-ornithine N(5)-monooxygenase n=1 Tax=Penicillium capsulatum TaxID=69766 RepID=A0A9W9LW08_9EURO|nr:hypothetical protein N7492_003341 [Penicillium capsulatum]KAJ6122075.1 hypothetical protein N7512_004540 [Penicillium capsulatum]